MRGISILIVEDTSIWAEVLARFLARAGYNSKTARSIQEAMEMLSKESYELAIVDLRLTDGGDPNDVSGINIINWLRDSHRDTKVIVISAYGTVEIAKDLFRLGVAGIYDKATFGPAEFLVRVGEILKSS